MLTRVSMSYDDYDALDGIRASRLALMGKSPRHYADGYSGKDTAGRDVLRAMHAAILEPEAFGADFAVCKVRRDARTKAFQAWQDEHPDRTALTEAEWERVHRVRDSVWAHPVIRGWLVRPGWSEVVYQWEDRETGALCKARLDRLIGPNILDLKGYGTTALVPLAKRAAQGSAHIQQAHYAEAVAVCEGMLVEDVRSMLLVYETERPYDCGLVELAHDGALFLGLRERARLMKQVAECEAAGEWPGNLPHVVPLEMPAWAWGDDEEFIQVEEV